jgi:hypothetical protein
LGAGKAREEGGGEGGRGVHTRTPASARDRTWDAPKKNPAGVGVGAGGGSAALLPGVGDSSARCGSAWCARWGPCADSDAAWGRSSDR